jgi:hypothetical protein
VIPSKGVQIYTIYYWTQAFADPEVENTNVYVRYDPDDLGTAYAFAKGRWVQCVSQHYSRLQGHSERELQTAAAEFRRQSTAHAQQFDARLKSRADFLQEVANVDAVRLQRLKDLENKTVLRTMGVTQSHGDEPNIGPSPPPQSTEERCRLPQLSNDELTVFIEAMPETLGSGLENGFPAGQVAAFRASSKVRPPAFVELLPPHSSSQPQCILEVEGRHGRLRIHCHSVTTADPAGLSRASGTNRIRAKLVHRATAGPASAGKS